MLAKSATLPTDEVLLDLEDSVAPALKDEARANIVRAVKEHSWAGKTLAVRINPVQARCCYRDIIEVVDAVGELIDCLVVPKVEDSSDVVFVDRLLGMVEGSNGIGKRVLIEAQIETAAALRRIHEIAHASNRLDALVFGPADMSASLGVSPQAHRRPATRGTSGTGCSKPSWWRRATRACRPSTGQACESAISRASGARR
jgi:citrate lyase subunit beta/citryl-CoA lyase